MSIKHIGEPRNVAYDESSEPYYSTKHEEKLSYIRSDSGTIFAGEEQYKLFLTCMALAKFLNKEPKELKKKLSNISTSAMRESGRWLILALGISNKENITCLKDEREIYNIAEQYANAGFEALKNLLEYHGAGFGEWFEIELLKISNEFIESEKNNETE